MEGSIEYCMKCKIHGHDISGCRKKGRNLAPSVKGKEILTESNERLQTVTKTTPKEGEWIEVRRKKNTKSQSARDELIGAETSQGSGAADIVIPRSNKVSEEKVGKVISNKNQEE